MTDDEEEKRLRSAIQPMLDAPPSPQWFDLPEGTRLGDLIDTEDNVDVRGLQVQLAGSYKSTPGELVLIGDVNRLGGVCNDCSYESETALRVRKLLSREQLDQP